MKCFVFFDENGHYYGYSKSKKDVKAFKKQRKKKFNIYEVKGEELKKLESSALTSLYYLLTTDMDSSTEQIKIFGHEISQFDTELFELTNVVISIFESFVKHSKMLKLTESEDDLMNKFVTILDEILYELEDEHEPNFSECFKIDVMLKEFLDLK